MCGQRAVSRLQWFVLFPLASVTYGATEDAVLSALVGAKVTTKVAATLRPARPPRDVDGADLYASPKSIDEVLVTLVGLDGFQNGAGGRSANGRSSAAWAS